MVTTTIEREFGWRTWIGRAIFEVALILVGILAAFAVTEWRDARDQQARVGAVMAAVRAELTSNLKALEEANTYNTSVVDRLKVLGTKKATSIPDDAYPRGLMLRPPLSSAAWDAAREGGVLNEVPVPIVLTLGRTYEAQHRYVESTARVVESFYSIALQTKTSPLPEPGFLAGILNDFAGRGRGLIARYRSTLEDLSRAR